MLCAEVLQAHSLRGGGVCAMPMPSEADDGAGAEDWVLSLASCWAVMTSCTVGQLVMHEAQLHLPPPRKQQQPAAGCQQQQRHHQAQPKPPLLALPACTRAAMLRALGLGPRLRHMLALAGEYAGRRRPCPRDGQPLLNAQRLMAVLPMVVLGLAALPEGRDDARAWLGVGHHGAPPAPAAAAAPGGHREGINDAAQQPQPVVLHLAQQLQRLVADAGGEAGEAAARAAALQHEVLAQTADLLAAGDARGLVMEATSCWEGVQMVLLQGAAPQSPPAWPAPSGLRLCAYPGCRTLSGASEAGLRLGLCGGCGCVRYCCRRCAKHHWAQGHKLECVGLRGG